MGVALLRVTPNDPFAKFLLPVPMTLCSAGPEVLVPKEGMFSPGDTTMIPLNWKLKLQPSHFGLLLLLNQWATKRVAVLVGVTDPHHQGEMG